MPEGGRGDIDKGAVFFAEPSLDGGAMKNNKDTVDHWNIVTAAVTGSLAAMVGANNDQPVCKSRVHS
jgi:hypothetical protein